MAGLFSGNAGCGARKFLRAFGKKCGKLLRSEKGEGIAGMVTAVAVVLVVAGFIMVPGLRNFATTVLNAMTTWWTNTVASKIFPTT